MTLSATPRSKAMAVLRVSSGNFLEMYDVMVYGYDARHIGYAFFPTGNEFSSLMLSLATFGAGYLMRPLGALVHLVDRGDRQLGDARPVDVLRRAMRPGGDTAGGPQAA